MDQAEASGRTVEDALNQALAKLGATRDEVEFVVLDEGSKGGLFGRGKRDAVVRVERTGEPRARRDEPRRPADTRIPRGAAQGGGRSGRGTGAAREPREPRAPRDSAPRSGGERPRGARTGGGRSSGRSLEAATPKLTEADFTRPRYDDETDPGAAPAGRARGEDRPPRDRGPRDGNRARRPREEQPEIAPNIHAEEVDFAASIVDDMLRLLDIPAELNIREPLTPGDGLGSSLAVIDISGDDLGLLIGRRGDTLLSLQYLVNLIVSRRFPGKGGVSIDVEHYRHRREEQVMALAQRMADRVRETGNAITLEPMPAAERRLIHMALADDPELETNSVGDGDNRKVVISARR